MGLYKVYMGVYNVYMGVYIENIHGRDYLRVFTSISYE